MPIYLEDIRPQLDEFKDWMDANVGPRNAGNYRSGLSRAIECADRPCEERRYVGMNEQSLLLSVAEIAAGQVRTQDVLDVLLTVHQPYCPAGLIASVRRQRERLVGVDEPEGVIARTKVVYDELTMSRTGGLAIVAATQRQEKMFVKFSNRPGKIEGQPGITFPEEQVPTISHASLVLHAMRIHIASSLEIEKSARRS